MAGNKRKYNTIKPGKKSSSGYIAVIIIIVVFLCIGSIVTFFIIDYAIDKVEVSSGVTVNMFVSGDDLVINIIGGERVDELECIYVKISNYELPESEIVKPVKMDQKEIVYEGFVNKYKFTGSHLVAVRGLFSDGKTVQITSRELRFS